jgi:hypothetical protein
VLADVRDRFGSGHAVENGDAREGGAGPSATAGTRDLHALCGRTEPRCIQRIASVGAVRGKPEVRPVHPPRLPRDGPGLFGEQVDTEVRADALWCRQA